MSKSNKYLKEYNKELKRLKQAIKRVEKQGYTVPENLIPKTPKTITAGSVRRLAQITPQKIREKSQANIISAKPTKANEKKHVIKKEQSKLSAQVKKDKEQRKKIDKKAKQSLKKLKENEEFRKSFSEGEIVYRKILDLCTKYNIDNPKGTQIVKGILQDEFNQFGKDNVILALSKIDNEELLEIIEYSFRYGVDSPQSNSALYEISMLIEGAINFNTRKKLDEALANDENWEDIRESEWSDMFGVK